MSYKPSADEVKRLRDDPGGGMIDCRNALLRAEGDFNAAKRELQERGHAKATSKANRTASEGLVASYIHAGGKMGALVEVNCETDFVARNERFAGLVRDIAMHVVAMSPAYLDRAGVPPEALAEVRAQIAAGGGENGKPAGEVADEKLNKWYESHCLLEQPFIKDDDQTVGELITSVVGILGENIVVRRFAKFALGEG